MESWAMYTVDGNELTRGMQMPERKAREVAQRTANRINAKVELIPEDAEEGSGGELFAPSRDA